MTIHAYRACPRGVGIYVEVETSMEVVPGWLHPERALWLLASHWLEFTLASLQNQIPLHDGETSSNLTLALLYTGANKTMHIGSIISYVTLLPCEKLYVWLFLRVTTQTQQRTDCGPNGKYQIQPQRPINVIPLSSSFIFYAPTRGLQAAKIAKCLLRY